MYSDVKKYIDYLRDLGKLDFNYRDEVFGDYMGIVFQAKNYPEFEEFDNYINQLQNEARIQNMPNEAKKLLDLMQSNIYKFCSVISLTESANNISESTYYDFPIFSYMLPNDFMEKFLMLPTKDKFFVFSRLKKRCQDLMLLEEINFLYQIRDLFLIEIKQKEGELSGYLLSRINESYLKEAINHLEEIKRSQPPTIL